MIALRKRNIRPVFPSLATTLPVMLLAVAFLGLMMLGCSTEAASPSSSAPATTAAPSITQTTAAQAAYITVEVEEAAEQLNLNEDAQMVDVREPSEWASTGVPVEAVLIPLGELKQRAPGELAKDRPVYVICKSGNRSRTGSQILIDLGYAEVYNVAGGIQAWLRAGLPAESYAP